MLEAGDIVRFHHLWQRQADAGEEASPVCRRGYGRSRRCLPVCHHLAGFDRRSPLVGDQRDGMPARRPRFSLSFSTNRTCAEFHNAYDFESSVPPGSFSPAFIRKIAGVAKQAAASRRLSARIRLLRAGRFSGRRTLLNPRPPLVSSRPDGKPRQFASDLTSNNMVWHEAC